MSNKLTLPYLSAFKRRQTQWVLVGFCMIATIAGVTPLPSSAEQIKIFVGNQGENVSKPTTGMSKLQVKQQYGEPTAKERAVGQPPISTWQYTDFDVYFEYDHVIHSVVKHNKP